MTDVDSMVVWLREAMNAAQHDAEAAARAFPAWEFDECVKEVRDVPNAGTVASIAVPAFGPHIARQSPAAVLRRTAADRKLLAECESAFEWDNWGAASLVETAIRRLAEGYGWAEETTT
ncbi:DUF6221 family protein [Streptomyces sp. NPDC056188]|uniref:DUF6221 family protein n=1 Tax=Streptomyces sp. NPDC056188 TaxID=3345740 RepID=UPI0035D83FE1